MTLDERFWSKVLVTESVDACWLWTGPLVNCGYAQFHLVDRMVMSHRVAYELAIGEIPDGLELDHLCRNRSCCNPHHLEPVTHAENIRRSTVLREGKTHCLRGHPLSGENLFVRRNGVRECKICQRAQLRRSRARAKERVLGHS